MLQRKRQDQSSNFYRNRKLELQELITKSSIDPGDLRSVSFVAQNPSQLFRFSIRVIREKFVRFVFYRSSLIARMIMQRMNMKKQMRLIQCMYPTHFVSGLSGFLR